ncbi:MAG: hypothetical protein AWL62_2549, partial [Halanaerobium sp. T82-1]
MFLTQKPYQNQKGDSDMSLPQNNNKINSFNKLNIPA